MSNQAITWAYSCQEVDSIEKFVLVTLANYADEFGVCFPSQSTLVEDCRCSDRKLRNALKALGERGLITRYERRRSNGSRRSDAVLLTGFANRKPLSSPEEHPVLAGLQVQPEAGSEPTNRHHVPGGQPAPRAGGSGTRCRGVRHHVPPLNLQGNHQENLTTSRPLAELEAQCLAACGPGLCAEGRKAIVGTSGLFGSWLEEGCELEADILPILRERTARERQTPIRTWDYFTEAIREARRRRLAQATSEAPAATERHAEKTSGPEPSAIDPVERMAAWINSDAYVPPSAVSNTMRDELLARGLVTEATLRRRQIY